VYYYTHNELLAPHEVLELPIITIYGRITLDFAPLCGPEVLELPLMEKEEDNARAVGGFGTSYVGGGGGMDLTPDLLRVLAMKARSDGKPCQGVRVPDTVVLSRGGPIRWYSNRCGTVVVEERHQPPRQIPPSVRDAMCKQMYSEGSRFDGVAAEYLSRGEVNAPRR
jgi:hypothetical protein